MQKHVLVTGATGFTGGHLCRRLVKEGYSVRVLVRRSQQGDELRRCGMEPVIGDLQNLNALATAVAGIDTVYHIAALFRQENVSRKDMWETNVEGTRNILEAAVKAGVKRFVHCSTIGVHGDIKNPPATESTPYAPGDYYQESKTEGEKVALQYSAEGKLPIVIIRPGGIYGPGDLRFLKLFKGIKKRRFIMLGSGQILYQLIYIDDLVEGILRCGTMESAINNTYILTGTKAVALNHLIQVIADAVDSTPPRLHFPVMPVYLASFVCELLCKPFGIEPPLYRRRVDFFRKTRSFDISKAQQELKFQPSTDLESGIRQTAQWYQSQGLL